MYSKCRYETVVEEPGGVDVLIAFWSNQEEQTCHSFWNVLGVPGIPTVLGTYYLQTQSPILVYTYE